MLSEVSVTRCTPFVIYCSTILSICVDVFMILLQGMKVGVFDSLRSLLLTFYFEFSCVQNYRSYTFYVKLFYQFY